VKKGTLIVELERPMIEALLDALDCYDQDALEAKKEHLSMREWELLCQRIERGRNRLARALTEVNPDAGE
jgi:hypothetical protein